MIRGRKMEVVGIGTDIIEIERFQRNGKRPGERFMLRCFTEREREYLKNRPLESIAGLFAAKEAVVKALGTGFAGFWPSAIELLHNKAGKPEVVLHKGAGKAAKALGITKIDVSISHCRTMAVAMAVAQKD